MVCPPLAVRDSASIYICTSEYRGLAMLSRRSFLNSVLAGSAAGGIGLPHIDVARAEAVLTEDGFYREPWFLESFLELADDLAAAGEKKKRLAIMWELRGCPY